MTRRDILKCAHEPFGDAFYYGPERLSERFADDEAARVNSGFSESTYRTIMNRLENDAKDVRFSSPQCSCSLWLSIFPWNERLRCRRCIRSTDNAPTLWHNDASAFIVKETYVARAEIQLDSPYWAKSSILSLSNSTICRTLYSRRSRKCPQSTQYTKQATASALTMRQHGF